MQVKTRLAAAFSVTLVAGAVIGATVGLTGPASATTGTSGGTWGASQPLPSPTATAPATGGSGVIDDITCTAPGDCVAVGDETIDSGTTPTLVPVAVTETAGTWGSAQQIDGTADLGHGTSAGLTKVSCSDADDCVAIGTYQGTDLQGQAFYATETAGDWSTATPLSVAGQSTETTSSPRSVSCPPSVPGYCAIAGYYDSTTSTTVNGTTTTTTTVNPFILDETQGAWETTAQSVPGLASLSATGGAEVMSISCAAQEQCAAGGEADRQPFVVSETPGPAGDPGTWGSAQVVTGGVSSGAIDIVSCPDVGECTAAGTYSSLSKALPNQEFTVDEQQGSWGSPTLLANSSLSDSGDPNLSCSSAGNCVLTGVATTYVNSFPYTEAVADSETRSGQWGALAFIGGFPSPADNPKSVPAGVSCAPGGACTIIGWYDSGKVPDSYQGFAMTISDGVIGNEQPVLPATDVGLTDAALSCPQSGFCTLTYRTDGVTDLVTEATGATVSLAASTSRVAVGSESAETLTAMVSGADGSTPTGTVAVTDGTTPVCTITLAASEGTCSPAPTAIPAGVATLTATYRGDVNYVAATSAAVTVTVDPPSTSGYTPLAPVRILDTRNGTGGFSSRVGAGQDIAVQVTGQDGVPASGVTAVVVNLTATNATTSSYVTAYPDGTARPAQGSNLNFSKGETIPNLVTVPVGADSKIDLYNNAGSVNLVADLQGYYAATSGSGLTPDGPVRILDTRNGTGGFSSPVGAGKDIAVQVTGQDGVPATGVTAVVLNLTATGPTASGWVVAYPDGTTRPAEGSNLNFSKGETIPNLVTVPVGAGGKVDLYNSAGSVNLVADVQGYYTATGGSALATDGPVRVLDTRNGTGGFSSPVGAGKDIVVQVTGRDGVPASGVTAVVLNLTATGPTTSSWVVAYLDGTARPAQGSDLNFTKGETIPNLVIVPVGPDGKIDLYNSADSVNLVADLQGYFTG